MRFWDSSAIVPLLIEEETTDYCLQVLADDPKMLSWCLSKLEVISALCRSLRDGVIDAGDFEKAKKRLSRILGKAAEITAVDRVRSRALRLLEVHPLRAAGACQLGAALVSSREDPERFAIICFDRGLQSAAAREGFTVNPLNPIN